MAYSVVGQPLADIPLDCIALATMHIILGITKKIYEWLLKLFTTLEHLEEQKNKGRTTYQFRQVVEEAIKNSNRYVEFLKSEFKAEVESIDSKRAETEHLMAEIAKTEKTLSTAKLGKRQNTWVRKLQILKEQCEINKTTEDELAFYEQFIYQMWLAKSTAENLKEIAKEHGGGGC